jgi:hypothetical protein
VNASQSNQSRAAGIFGFLSDTGENPGGNPEGFSSRGERPFFEGPILDGPPEDKAKKPSPKTVENPLTCQSLQKVAAGSAQGELEWQARWFAGEFGKVFQSTAGEHIQIVQFGIWNRVAGPDFVEAAIRVDGGLPLRGAIELDPDVRDWERHGHAVNPDYEGVVLHVFSHCGEERFFSRTRGHRIVPQTQLSSSGFVGGVFGPEIPVATPGRCSRKLESLPLSQLAEVLQTAARLRFDRKAGNLVRSGEAHGEAEALYQALASGLGYPGNKLAFRLLAQRLPLSRLLEEPDSAEALLFGVAGMLPGPDLGGLSVESLGYVRALWERWWPHRASLHALQIPSETWCMVGQRPANHPLRRLGALSVLMRHWRALKRLVIAQDWKRLRVVLGRIRHPFWSFHYTFAAKRSTQAVALLGDERLDELFINVFLPFVNGWDALLKMRAPERNRRSRIAATRLLARRQDVGKLLGSAVHQQGLLQLYEDFCSRDASNCENCPFPEQVAHWLGT